jgi:hypothetical protein
LSLRSSSVRFGSAPMANLTKLNLYKNKIGDEGMKAFAAAVSSGARCQT